MRLKLGGGDKSTSTVVFFYYSKQNFLHILHDIYFDTPGGGISLSAVSCLLQRALYFVFCNVLLLYLFATFSCCFMFDIFHLVFLLSYRVFRVYLVCAVLSFII